MLELRDVVVRYGAFTALRGVSLRVDAGEIVSLLGGNASGKSTTLKAALGLLAPVSGTIAIDGADATHATPAARVRGGLASVPEARRVFAAMTVEENLLLGAFVRNDRKAVQADLERAYAFFPRLSERRRQAAGSLSGGEQQMLAIARALMSRPRLICMDEPTMGLAPVFVERVLEQIIEINRTGTAILLVEQNAAAALTIAHRGYVLRAGEIVASGEARSLLEDPSLQAAYLGGP
jgi:branched-chain amino acid transport system ATP-binding protein